MLIFVSAIVDNLSSSLPTTSAVEDLPHAVMQQNSLYWVSNEMVTPTPCESYAFAGYFYLETITMSDLALVGIDLGKHTFHLHGQDKRGRELFRKKLSRQQMMRFFGNLPACTVVMEACAGAHFSLAS